MLKSNEFDLQVFEDPTEGQLLDRKIELYPLLSSSLKLAEFVKDVIALANSARQRGRNAYLLFGVDDNRNPIGIKGQDIISPPRSNTLKYDNDNDIEKVQGEMIGRVISLKIKEYIGHFGATYEYGFFKGVLVSYLLIPGRTLERWRYSPYQTIKDIGDKSTGIIEAV